MLLDEVPPEGGTVGAKRGARRHRPRQPAQVGWRLIIVPLTLTLIATSCTRGSDEPVPDDRGSDGPVPGASDDRDEPDSEPTVTGDEVVAAVGADGARVELEGVATLEVPAGALPEGATVTLRRADPLQPDGGVLEMAGPAVNVSASEPLSELVTLTLRFDRTNVFADLPAEVADVLLDEAADFADSFQTEVVAVARLAGDDWELLGSQVDLGAGTVSAKLDRLSTFAPVGGAVDRLADLTDRAWQTMLDSPRSDPPSCDPPPTVTATGLGEWGCATVNGDGWLLVHVANSQGFAVDLTLPDEAERVSAYHPRLSEQLVAVVGERLHESNVVWLPPAAGVSFRVPYDPETTVRYQFGLQGSMDSVAATAVAYLLDAALDVTGVGFEMVECAHQRGHVLDPDTPIWLAFAILLWETAACGGWQSATLVKSPLMVVQALLSVELEPLERAIADVADGEAWGATLTVTHDTPVPDEPPVAAGVSRIEQQWGVLGPVEPLGSDGATGSGCSPGTPDTLPDGVWFGFVADLTATEVEFDLACLYTGEEAYARGVHPDGADILVVNDSPALRRLPVGADSRFFLHADPFESGLHLDRLVFGPGNVDAFWSHLASLEPWPGATSWDERWREAVGVWVLVEDGEAVEILELGPGVYFS